MTIITFGGWDRYQYGRIYYGGSSQYTYEFGNYQAKDTTNPHVCYNSYYGDPLPSALYTKEDINNSTTYSIRITDGLIGDQTSSALFVTDFKVYLRYCHPTCNSCNVEGSSRNCTSCYTSTEPQPSASLVNNICTCSTGSYMTSNGICTYNSNLFKYFLL